MREEHQHLPVAGWGRPTALVGPDVGLELHEVPEGVLAELVRTRLVLEHGRGWVLLSGLVVTVGAVVGLGLGVQSKLVLGVLAPIVASVPFGAGLMAERACWLVFERLARARGLNAQASRRIFEGALGADHWMAVLSSCGRAPTDGEIARFVVQGGPTRPAPARPCT